MAIVEIKKMANFSNLKNPTVIVGFPGTGLVGSVAASHLIDVLKLDFGGYIESEEFAPLAAIHDYTPMPAARIHYSEKYNLILVLSEMSVPVVLAAPLADAIFDFAKSLKCNKIISIGGISLKEGKTEVYVIASNKEMTKDITEKRIAKPIREGATTGVTGLLLTKGALEKFPIITLLAESSDEYLDADAASRVLKALAKILNIEISTARLDKEAKGTKEALIKSKVSKRGATVDESAGGSMYG
ncbi:MAG: PAC2 family protein [Candidatus Bilamarchaeaceae archaeon]